MKRFFAVAVLSVSISACGQNVLDPSASKVSSGGVLPRWMFAFNGHLVRPDFGTYGVYAGPEIVGRPKLREQLEHTIVAANDLTDGRVRFVLTSDATAPITMRLNANDPRLVPGAAVGVGDLRIVTGYTCAGITIVIRDERWFLTNVPLHELGHFLFGPGHSDTPEDIMNVAVRDYSRMSFSSHEKTLWKGSLVFAPGTVF